jgi:hypothetical protein
MGDDRELEDESDGDTSEGIELSEELPASLAVGLGTSGVWVLGMGGWYREGKSMNGGNVDLDVNLSSTELNLSAVLALVSILITRSSEMTIVV